MAIMSFKKNILNDVLKGCKAGPCILSHHNFSSFTKLSPRGRHIYFVILILNFNLRFRFSISMFNFNF